MQLVDFKWPFPHFQKWHSWCPKRKYSTKSEEEYEKLPKNNRNVHITTI